MPLGVERIVLGLSACCGRTYPWPYPRGENTAGLRDFRAQRTGLENRCGRFRPPWVRIPPPPLQGRKCPLGQRLRHGLRLSWAWPPSAWERWRPSRTAKVFPAAGGFAGCWDRVGGRFEVPIEHFGGLVSMLGAAFAQRARTTVRVRCREYRVSNALGRKGSRVGLPRQTLAARPERKRRTLLPLFVVRWPRRRSFFDRRSA